MNQKISTPVAIAIAAVVLVIIVIAGTTYYRKATGADVADQMHAAMQRTKPGQSPFSPQQREQMKSGEKASHQPAPGAP